MADISNFDKKKEIKVTSVSGEPTISKTLCFKLTSGDDSTTGTGEIVLDWSNITDKTDICIFDESGNLLDYAFESFDATAESAVIWVYKDWIRDDSIQAQIAYGNGDTDNSVTLETVFSKETGLQGAWLFNETSGDALDVSGNNNDGTVYGAKQGETGIIDGAYSFDGNDDYVEVSDDDSLDGQAPVSIIAWIKPSRTGDFMIIATKGYTNGWIYRYRPSGNGEDMDLWFNNKHTSDMIVPDNEWSYIAVTWDGSDIIHYLNSNSNSKSTSDTIPTNTQSFEIGKASDASDGDNYGGIMDGLYIYNAALSSDTIVADYAATKTTPDFFSQTAELTEINISNPSPSDGATSTSIDTTLSVDVTHPDGSDMDVTFYWDDSTIIEEVSNVASGSTAETSSLSLDYYTTYDWYVEAEDATTSNSSVQSNTYSFTTEVNGIRISNLSPSDGVIDIPLNTTLSVHVIHEDGEDMDVMFYWSNGNLIEEIPNVPSDTTAQTSNLNLLYGNTHNWYVEAEDADSATPTEQSTTYSFTTRHLYTVPSGNIVEGMIYQVIGDNITYNSTTYNPGDYFTGVSGVTDYSGNGYVTYASYTENVAVGFEVPALFYSPNDLFTDESKVSHVSVSFKDNTINATDIRIRKDGTWYSIRDSDIHMRDGNGWNLLNNIFYNDYWYVPK